jgi:dipicolinic acid synthetase B subunit
MSENAYYTDTRFQKAEEFSTRVEALCQKRVIHTVVDAEPLGPKTPLDALVVSPCTGNTLSKVARGITDTAATMAIKAHLRSDRPLIIALASNDAMSQNLSSIAAVLNRKADLDVLALDQLGGDGIQAEEVGDGTQDGVEVTAGEYGSIFHGVSFRGQRFFPIL